LLIKESLLRGLLGMFGTSASR